MALEPSRSSGRSAKISVTVDPAVLGEVRKLLRRRGGTLSAHINETLAEDLRRRKLAALVSAYEAEHGEITEAELARVRASMRGR
jgi:cytosine/adenosine deaminase-related metal-dependent hydrolase